MKLIIGVPTAGSPAKPFLESVTHLEIPPLITAASNITISGNFVPAQRELIVRHALREQADMLLMIDDDIVAPPFAVTRLLDVMQTDPQCGLAGGLYYSRDGLRPMAVANWDPHDTAAAHTPAFENAAVQVDGVGFGCVLIRCSVFSRMSEPYFAAQVYLEENARRARICNEDYLFCHALRGLGFRAYLHAGVRLGHYDRASGRTIPELWENAEATNRRRMTVMEGGAVRLAPLDTATPAIRERHVRADIEYISPETT